ncbi:hypothetical protein BDF14DRAFT_1883484 [Spinellus fusiger]|nr:hypothetical protein BDF14DRAFT_1883484 [Spinellus fusiger]
MDPPHLHHQRPRLSPKQLSHRTPSSASYPQAKRRIYINTRPLSSPSDDGSTTKHSHPKTAHVSNRIHTAKYTLLTFIPKNLFEQFRNVANLYFLFLVVLQCIPLFGVTEPAVSALPLIAILVLTGLKDAFEDWKRNNNDTKVNQTKTLTLYQWRNVNVSRSKVNKQCLSKVAGFFSVLAGIENDYAHSYRASQKRPVVLPRLNSHHRTVSHPSQFSETVQSQEEAQATPPPHRSTETTSHTLLNSVRQRSDTLRSELTQWLVPSQNRNKKPFRPGAIPHSVLYRPPTTHASNTTLHVATTHPSFLSTPGTPSACTERATGEPGTPDCRVRWQCMEWQDLNVGDYVMVRNNEAIPADIVLLSTSEKDNVCYVETQNLDGETNLKARQGLQATQGLVSVHDCERVQFYIEVEPPHAHLYQFSGALRWDVMSAEEETSNVSHQKTEPVSYNNLVLRGCSLRNTEWVLGVVVYTGNETKIMLNSGKTPSKRSKMAKATNPHVIANFAILAILAIVSSILNSVYFNASGSSHFFGYGIEGQSGTYSGFLTFWVSLILYQNIVPISLYISVEIVKTCAAYFIYSDIDMYHPETDTPCIPKTWNISDDLGQIEYVFSDKTGTLTQNIMEFRKCTIHGVAYGVGTTEAMEGEAKRKGAPASPQMTTASSTNTPMNNVEDQYSYSDDMQEARNKMQRQQSALLDNPYMSSNPTFVDPTLLDSLATPSDHTNAILHFFSAMALCHTAMANYPDPHNKHHVDYKAQSPDESALVSAARDLGFVFLGREANVLKVKVMGIDKTFELLNTLEFNSTRKRMSVILKPHDSQRILLLCKGADSVIMERLCQDMDQQQVQEQQAIINTTQEDLERFANQGLRTLCLSYRFISQKEYTAWNKRHEEACASIHDREEKLEQVYDLIERDMLLMGGTAIEDRLQLGVPETIAELSKSGMKLWVLTGDKTETAINIGFSCNLLTVDMELVMIKAQTKEETRQQLLNALEQSNADAETDKKRALVIDGTTLCHALSKECSSTLLLLAMQCASVLCCRVSPMQKAQVVLLVKKGLNVMTLAIGDGANDVSMIQAANVGVGISGVEGRQAVMASDYAIAQFRYLHKLLIVHGRWSYLRTAEMIMGFFFKNIVWTFVLFWYQIFCQFSGSMVFDYALVTLYNLLFTSLPIIFLGIWDQDLPAYTSLKYPELYRMGLRNDKFKRWRFWLTIFDSIFQSSVCFFFPYMLLIGGTQDPNGYDQSGMYEIGTLISSIAVIVANLFAAISLHHYTWLQALGIILSILVYYTFVAVYSQFNVFTFAGQVHMFGTGMYWLILLLTVVTCYLPRIAVTHFRRQYTPYDNDIVREIEFVASSQKLYIYNI